MRLKHFLNEDEKTFQQLNIGLVKRKSNYEEVVRKISEEYKLGSEIIETINYLNEKLKNVYKGKFKFDFCIQEDININELKVKKAKLLDRLKEDVFKSRHTLAKNKTNMERKIKER